LAEFRQFDFLVLNACLPVLRMRVEPATLGRIHEFLAKAFALVSTPLAFFARAVNGWKVLISSIYVETAPRDFSQYVALKAAVEGLFRAAAAQAMDNSGYLIVRSPKLLTDMTNAPFGTGDAMAAEKAALSLLGLLRDPPREPGEVKVVSL